MKVKELIEKLQHCNPDATVCVEVWSDPMANEVKEYETDIGPCVYIGDNLEELEYQMNEEE